MPPARTSKDSFIEDLVNSLAARRNETAAEVKKLQTELGEKSRELRVLEEALKALKGATKG